MSEPDFKFRQRSGKLNWRLLSSIDFNKLVQHVKIEELQG
jgi:hypothetical protein